MKKHKLSKHIIISIVISALLLLKIILQQTSILGQIISMTYGFGQEAGSIGIIGDSDGPTTVFLSSPLKYLFVLPVLDILGIIYVLIILILCYRILIKDKIKE